MKKHIILCTFLISCTLQNSIMSSEISISKNNGTFLSLHKELIQNILKFTTNDYPQIMLCCKKLMIYFFDFLIDKQHELLQKEKQTEKEEKKIIVNNQFLLLIMQLKLIKDIDAKCYTYFIKKWWSLGALVYEKNDSDTYLYYIAYNNDIKKLYIVHATNELLLNMNKEKNTRALEWNGDNFNMNLFTPIKKSKKDLNQPDINTIKEPKTFYMEIKLVDPEKNIDLNNSNFKKCIDTFTSIKIHTPDMINTLVLPDKVKELEIHSPLKNLKLSDSKFNVLHTLSLIFFLDKNTNKHCFDPLNKLIHLKKLSLDFVGNSLPNTPIICPKKLETLLLKNFSSKIDISNWLKHFTIVSPKKGCTINFFDICPYMDFTKKSDMSISIENTDQTYARKILKSIKENKYINVQKILINGCEEKEEITKLF